MASRQDWGCELSRKTGSKRPGDEDEVARCANSPGAMSHEQLIVVTQSAEGGEMCLEGQVHGEGASLEGIGHVDPDARSERGEADYRGSGDEDDTWSRSESEERIECMTCHKLLKLTSLRQHARTHSGGRPFACRQCSVRFTRKGDMERHVRIVHEKQRPHRCHRCPRAFTDLKNLRWHVANHDRSLLYVCSVCRFKFGKREYWENHVRFIHPTAARDGPATAPPAVGLGGGLRVEEHLAKLLAMDMLDSEAALSVEGAQDLLPADVLVDLSSVLGSDEGEMQERPSHGARVQEVCGHAVNITVLNITRL